MARGWESKSIEAQQDDATRRRDARARAAPSDAELARRSQRQSLELARRRTLADLSRASRPAHRAMLEAQLAAIDAKLGEI